MGNARFRIALLKILLATILAGLSIPAARPVAAAPLCSATSVITAPWNGGFVAQVTIANTGTTASSSWLVVWGFPDSTYVITNMWNANYAQSGASVGATNVAWNASIAPGGSTSLGFVANHPGTSHSMPSSIAVTCT